VADNSNTEELKLDTTQAAKAVKDLIRDVKQLKEELRQTSTYQRFGDPKKGLDSDLQKMRSSLREMNTLMKSFQQSLTSVGSQFQTITQKTNAQFEKFSSTFGAQANQLKRANDLIKAAGNVRGLNGASSGADISSIRTATEAQKAYQAAVLKTTQLIQQSDRIRANRGDTAGRRGIQNELQQEALKAAELNAAYKSLAASERAAAAASSRGGTSGRVQGPPLSPAALQRAAAQRQSGAAFERVAGVGAASTFGIQGRLLANYAVLGTGIGAALGTAREVIQLDNALHNLQAITRSSDTSMGILRQRILDVAVSSKFLSTEVAQAAVTLGQAGLSANQIGTALKAVSNLAAASGSDLNSAVQIITGAMGAFNLNASEAGDVANLFTAALNQSKLSMDQLTQGFTYSANAAAQLGVNYEELTTLLAALSNAGIKSGSTLGTNLRSLFVDLTDPSEKLVKTLARLGISLDDINVQTHSVTSVLRTLKDAGFTAADAFQTMQTRSAAAFVALTGQLDTLNDLQRGMVATKAASEAAAIQMESFANTAKNAFTVITAIASTSFQPMLDGLQTMLSGFVSIFKTVTQFKGALEAVGVIVAGLAARGGIAYLLGLAGATGAAGALAGGPAAGIAIGLALLVSLMGNAKQKMDALTAAVEEARGKNEEAKTSYQEVEKAIGDLLAKEQSLKQNKDDLKTTAIELGERFRALGLDVNGLEGDFDGLLGKLRELDKTQRDALKGSLNLLVAKQGQELAGLQGTSGSITGGGRNAIFNNSYGALGSVTGRSYASGGATQYGSFKSGSSIDRFLVRLASGGPLTADDFPLVQAAATQAARDNSPIGAAIEPMLQFTASLSIKKAAQEQTQSQLGTVAASDNFVFAGLESRASDAFRRLNASVPKRIGDDPVATERLMAQWLNAHSGEISGIENQFKLYGNVDAAHAGAVSGSSALQQLLGLREQVKGFRENARDPAKVIRSQAAEIAAAQVEKELETLEQGLQHAETPDELKDAAEKVLHKLPELFKAQASSELQKLGFSPDEINIDTNTYTAGVRGGVRVTEGQRAQINAFNSGFGATIGRVNNGINEKSDNIAKDTLQDRITTIRAGIAATERQIRDAFKNVDQYTPASQIQERADKALTDLAGWWLQQLDLLQKQTELEKISPEEYQQRLADLNDQYSSRRDELTDHTKGLKYDYSRPLAPGDDPYSNIRKALATPGPDTTDFANTFSESMIAAIDSVKQSFGDLWSSVLSGQKSVLSGFKSFAASILQAMQSVIANKIAQKFFSYLMKFIPGGDVGAGADAGAGDIGAGDVAGHTLGGYIRRFAGGGGTRDSILARLTPGEFVLRNAAVEAVGRDNLEKLNAMGSSRVSRAGIPTYQRQDPAVTNVYVVQKDRVPQLGKNDILVTVHEDILTNGTTKKLIKQVSMGG
jgi:TP901 family phage tail tape measure protein